MKEANPNLPIWHSFVYHLLTGIIPTLLIFLAAIVSGLLTDYYGDPIFILLSIISIPISITLSLRADDIFSYFYPKYSKSLPR